jgi:hypothetical protein
VVESRPISATLQDSGIVVKAPPLENQPASFRGAVGTYTLSVSATPAEVSVGDPIILTVAIRGTGRMDWLRAPKLARQELLTADFHVPDSDLAGTVNGMDKQFTQTIRAKRDDITDIPPIEFSYFDPHEERYVTLKSAPVPLTVKPSPALAVSRTVGDVALDGARTELTPVESGLLANYDDAGSLLRQQSLSLGWGTWVLAVSGPFFFLTSFVIRRQRDRAARHPGSRRRRSAKRRALLMIRRARSEADASLAASRIAAALTGYVTDHCNLPAGSATRGEIVDHLRQQDVPEEMVVRIDELLGECEAAQYAAAEGASTDEFAQRARGCVNELDRQRF